MLVLEQIIGIWAFLCKLISYECLFGVTPFEQENEKVMELLILEGKVCFPHDSLRKVSNSCKELIECLLVKDYLVRNNYSAKKLLEMKWFEDNSIDLIEPISLISEKMKEVISEFPIECEIVEGISIIDKISFSS